METTNVAKQNLNKLIKDLQNNRMEMNFNFNTAKEAADFCNLTSAGTSWNFFLFSAFFENFFGKMVMETRKEKKMDLKNVISKEFDDHHINKINSNKLLTQ